MSTWDNSNFENLSSVVCIYQQVFHEKSYWHLQLDYIVQSCPNLFSGEFISESVKSNIVVINELNIQYIVVN